MSENKQNFESGTHESFESDSHESRKFRKTDKVTIEHDWMIRLVCDDYKDEYEECTSIRGRFHQYFTIGEMKDCTQWKEDYRNCKKYRKTGSIEAGLKVIQSETERRNKRVASVRNNDIWEYRTSPPEDFNKPLPEQFKVNSVRETPSMCVVM